MSNAVVKAAQSLTLAEKRILFISLAKLGGKNNDVKITAEEYANTFGMPIKQAYDQLKSASENIWNRYVGFSIKDCEGKPKSEWRIRWIGSYGYEDGQGFVVLGFYEKTIPYLFDLTENFTKYQLSQAWALRSLYSWRLLELFEQVLPSKQKSGWLSISLDDFHHAMESKDSYKRNFSLLRIYVIEPAVKELTEKDNWIIDWKPKKQGRKVVRLEFCFKKNDQLKLI